MCTLTINVDQAAFREYDPSLSSTEALQKWFQRLADRVTEEVKKDAKVPPCSYSLDEARRLITDRLDRLDAGTAKTWSMEEVEQHMRTRFA